MAAVEFKPMSLLAQRLLVSVAINIHIQVTVRQKKHKLNVKVEQRANKIHSSK